MSVAVSRDNFDELKNYLGVYLQQGRVLLDSDWNENQDIAVSMQRRLTREALGDGSPNQGFAVEPIFPPPLELLLSQFQPSGGDLFSNLGELVATCIGDLINIMLNYLFGEMLFFLNFPGQVFDDFETDDGWSLGAPQGFLRLARDRPHHGTGFLRLSGHAGTVELSKTLPPGQLLDLSAFDLATYRFRCNEQVPGPIKFFIEDDAQNRTVWTFNNAALGKDMWLPAFVTPLDARFHIVTNSPLPKGYRFETDGASGFNYSAIASATGGATPMTWSVSDGALPPGLALDPETDPEDTNRVGIDGTPTAAGDFTFTLQVTDDDGQVAEREFTLEIGEVSPSDLLINLPDPLELLGELFTFELPGPNHTAADPGRIVQYGFELYQDPVTPLVWDLDDLRVASADLLETVGANNFIIRGSEFNKLEGFVTMFGFLGGAMGGGGGGGGGGPDEILANLLDLANTDFVLGTPRVQNAGRMYVEGIPCVQLPDVLYSDQADPDDPPLAPPATGTREDTVYLDVWEEPVTYVEDPAIRDVALGGPDTSTRRAAHHRVRVNQGGGLPDGNGMGRGTLATEGTYTGEANRLYRVQIDAAGDIGTAGASGTATFRWSDDNASTIQRVIDDVVAGSERLVVEDASALAVGDAILLSREAAEEEHEIAAIVGNYVLLQSGTVHDYAVVERPRIQRWNAFGVPVAVDPVDGMISAAIDLNDGVQVRFGGRAMLRGDYWTFTTRYLAGDDATGISPETRIERVNFALPEGIRHHYAPLGVIRRDANMQDPNRIVSITDRRLRVGTSASLVVTLPDVTGFTHAGTDPVSTHLGGQVLPPVSRESKLLVLWSANLYITGAPPGDSQLTVRLGFYNDEMTDPATDEATGRIEAKSLRVPLDRKANSGEEIPLHLVFAGSDTNPFPFLPMTFVPTSVQAFAEIDESGFTLELANIRMTILELKKSF